MATTKTFAYFVDDNEADQGVTGNGRSLKALLDTIGSNEATVYFTHHGSASTTYNLDTTYDVSSYDNVTFVFQHGAQIDGVTGDETITFPSPENIDAGDRQQIFGSSLTVSFTKGGEFPLHWWGWSTSASAANNKTYMQAAATAAAGAGGVLISYPGLYNMNGPIDVEEPFHLRGISGRPTLYGSTTDGKHVIIKSGDSNDMFDVAESSARIDSISFEKIIFDANSTAPYIIDADAIRHLKVIDSILLDPSESAIRITDVANSGYGITVQDTFFSGGKWAIDADACDSGHPSTYIENVLFNGHTEGCMRGPFYGVIINPEVGGLTTSGVIAFDFTINTGAISPQNITVYNPNIENLNGKGFHIGNHNIHIKGGVMTNSNAQANITHWIHFETDTDTPRYCTVRDTRLVSHNSDNASLVGIEIENTGAVGNISIENVMWAGGLANGTHTQITDDGNRAHKWWHGSFFYSDYAQIKIIEEQVDLSSAATAFNVYSVPTNHTFVPIMVQARVDDDLAATNGEYWGIGVDGANRRVDYGVCTTAGASSKHSKNAKFRWVASADKSYEPADSGEVVRIISVDGTGDAAAKANSIGGAAGDQITVRIVGWLVDDLSDL